MPKGPTSARRPRLAIAGSKAANVSAASRSKELRSRKATSPNRQIDNEPRLNMDVPKGKPPAALSRAYSSQPRMPRTTMKIANAYVPSAAGMMPRMMTTIELSARTPRVLRVCCRSPVTTPERPRNAVHVDRTPAPLPVNPPDRNPARMSV